MGTDLQQRLDAHFGTARSSPASRRGRRHRRLELQRQGSRRKRSVSLKDTLAMNEPFDPVAAAAEQIRAKVKMVAADETTFGVLSTGERIAVALVLERYDLLQRAWGPVLESVDRLGPLWTDAALRVQRHGWS